MAEKNGKAPQMEEEQDLSEILRVRREKLKNLQDQGKNPYEYTSFDAKQHAQEIVEHFEEEYDGKQVSVAGRIMSWRDMGKAAFMDLRDSTGRIQLYVKIDMLGEEAYRSLTASLDIGDIVGVTGEAFRTRRGEISVKADSVVILRQAFKGDYRDSGISGWKILPGGGNPGPAHPGRRRFCPPLHHPSQHPGY